ncbi:MAG: radical SAM protein [Ruminococcaceae bacterium]|nr:radical SAM protein [Oscillospiraceae bacterium]
MTIAYPYERSLYVNITNRCPNRCEFCVRTQADGYYANDLWLTREPSAEEILKDILDHEPQTYEAIVFCGYGEPTERLETMLTVCEQLKALGPFVIRLNTNGQSDLIAGRHTAPDLSGRIDILSISLNAATAESYEALCHSRFGLEAFPAILSFAKEAKKYVPQVIFSVVKDSIPDAEIDTCRIVAASCDIPLRVRDYIRTES